MKLKLYSFILLLFLVSSHNAHSEDIELYVNYDVSIEEKLRVLLVFDTSLSMSHSVIDGRYCKGSNNKRILCPDGSRLEVAQDAMINLINDNSDIEFGLMRLNRGAGGYVVHKIGTDHEVIKKTLKNWRLETLELGTPLAETFYEMWRYFTGDEVFFAKKLNGKTDSDTSIEKKLGNKYFYISPFEQAPGDPLRCDNNINVLLMTDGEPYFDNNRDKYIEAIYEKIYSQKPVKYENNHLATLATILHGKSGEERDIFDKTEVIDGANVYTVGFGKGLSEKAKRLLDYTAKKGDGKFIFAESAEELSKAFTDAIDRIREVNASFSAPAVASSNNDRSSFRESVYYPMFYPSNGARWQGNLKKLKIKNGVVVDLNNDPAMSSDGSILTSAKTYWLPNGHSADGGSVNKGGVNLYLSGVKVNERKILTDTPTGHLIEFTKDSLVNEYGDEKKTAKLFKAYTNQLENTIEWSRGVDVDNENKKSSIRSDIFGDPLHSKPVTIDYGNNDVRILIGTNAGYMHMFSDKNDELKESWAFMPAIFYPNVKLLRHNQINTKVYGVDGPISIFFDDKNRDGVVNNSDRVWAFFGMRRGGKNYYGLDITKPDNPKLMWGGPIVGGTGDFKELAQTWSKPIVTYIKLKGYESRPLLVFGAGFDTNKDNLILSNDNEGKGVYIVDAETGTRVWSLTPNSKDMSFLGDHSIASDVTLLDSDYDGYDDRIYFSDTGGNIWRVDMPTSDPRDSKQPWTYFKFASLASSTPTSDRRFFYKPYVARTVYSKVSTTNYNGEDVYVREDTPYDAILIGSGNRTNPLGKTVSDELFMIRDTNILTQSFLVDNIPKTITRTDLMNINDDPFSKVTDNIADFMEVEVKLGAKQGWYYSLQGQGEKSTAAATVIGGVAYFSTYTPDSDKSDDELCTIGEGEGAVYAFHLHYGTKVYDWLKLKTVSDLPDTVTKFVADGEVTIFSPFISDPEADCETDCGQGTFKPTVIQGPEPVVNEDGEVELTKGPLNILKLETKQTYIYKREVNDFNQ